ncbi:MAG: chemotaxis protein CheX [Chloroflexota bacterium]|nr:chemotaxis protein CheX [Dehalococcoidia bacterium]MDW8254519.1 chemotaxis protein CheX [Chloroflexota bacterium]
MKVEYINPFVRAASEVLERELGCAFQQGAASLHRSAYTTHDVTLLVAVSGDVRGVVLYCFAEAAACAIAAALLGQELPEFDDLAQSGIAELGDLITTAAGAYLSDAGYHATLSAPTLLIGTGTMVSALDLPRLVVPLMSDVGSLEIHIALRA